MLHYHLLEIQMRPKHPLFSVVLGSSLELCVLLSGAIHIQLPAALQLVIYRDG